MGKTTDLRRELKRTFYPYVTKSGFHIDKSTGPHSIVFRRFGPGHIDAFDIQWTKYGQVPSAGVTHFGVLSFDKQFVLLRKSLANSCLCSIS